MEINANKSRHRSPNARFSGASANVRRIFTRRSLHFWGVSAVTLHAFDVTHANAHTRVTHARPCTHAHSHTHICMGTHTHTRERTPARAHAHASADAHAQRAHMRTHASRTCSHTRHAHAHARGPRARIRARTGTGGTSARAPSAMHTRSL